MTAPPGSPAPSTDACLNCGNPLLGRFCSDCGQEAKPPLRPLRRSLSDFVEDFASLDFRVFHTLRTLLMSPGAVTKATVAGQRARFTPAFRLYLVISAISIAFMSASGLFSLDSMLGGADPSQRELLQAFTNADLSSVATAKRFDSRFNTLFPIFNLITPLGLALALKLVIRKTLLHAHAIAGLHIATAQVIYSSALIPVTAAPPWVQTVFTGAVLLVLAGHLWIFLRRVYGGTLSQRLLQVLAIAGAYAVLTVVITGLTLIAALATL